MCLSQTKLRFELLACFVASKLFYVLILAFCSLKDEKLQNVLGHFQKDFEGGFSAENLGKSPLMKLLIS